MFLNLPEDELAIGVCDKNELVTLQILVKHAWGETNLAHIDERKASLALPLTRLPPLL